MYILYNSQPNVLLTASTSEEKKVVGFWFFLGWGGGEAAQGGGEMLAYCVFSRKAIDIILCIFHLLVNTEGKINQITPIL